MRQAAAQVADVGPDVIRPDGRNALNRHAEKGRGAIPEIRKRHRPPLAPVPVLHAGPASGGDAADPDIGGGKRRGGRPGQGKRTGRPRSAGEVRDITWLLGLHPVAERPQLRRGRRDGRLDHGGKPDRRRPSPAGPVQHVGPVNGLPAAVGRDPDIRRRSPRYRPGPLVKRGVDIRLRRLDRLPRRAIPVPHHHGAVTRVVPARRRIGAGIPGDPRVTRPARPEPARRDAGQLSRDPPAGIELAVSTRSCVAGALPGCCAQAARTASNPAAPPCISRLNPTRTPTGTR